MSKILPNLLYSKTHEWVKIDGDVATIGLTDFAQEQLGDLVYAEAEPVETEVEIDGLIASVESVKAASDVYSPVAGTIVEANEELGDEPEKINADPYDVWFVKIEMSNVADKDALMDAAAYEKFCAEANA